MICDGQREFGIPGWLWAAVPLVSIVYVAFDIAWNPARLADANGPESIYFGTAAQMAAAWLAAFLLIDVAARSRTPWYSLPLLFVAAWLIAIVAVVDVFMRSAKWVVMALAAGALSAGGGGGGGGACRCCSCCCRWSCSHWPWRPP
jgi:hypothetical protein